TGGGGPRSSSRSGRSSTLKTRSAMHFGLPDFDAAAIKMANPRAFTKEISRYLYGLELPSGRPAAGVFHRSRHGEEHELWAGRKAKVRSSVSRTGSSERRSGCRRWWV